MSACSNAALSNLTGATIEEGETDGVALTVVTSILLFGLVFGMAGTVHWENFVGKFKKVKGIAIGVGCQFFILPLVGFLTVKMLGSYFNNEVLLAQMLVIVVSSPGGSYSNLWCSLVSADLALSVAMTTVSSILSMGMLPLNVFLYGTLALGADDGFDLPWADLGRSLGIVIVGIVCGLATGKAVPQYHWAINILGNVCGVSLIIVGIAFSSSGASGLFSKPIELYVSTVIPVLFGMGLALTLATLARLDKPERVAVAIETCYQNTGIAVAIAISFGSNPAIGKACAQEAAALPVIYGMAEIFFIGIFGLLMWKLGWTYAPSNENIFKVIAKDYQPHEDEADAASKANADAIAPSGA